MADTPEGRIQKWVIKFANGLGIRTIRLFFGPGLQTGWPDVLFLIPGGRPLFIEFKAPGKEPTPKQRLKIKHLKEAGYDVFVCDNKDKGCEKILQALEAARLSGARN